MGRVLFRYYIRTCYAPSFEPFKASLKGTLNATPYSYMEPFSTELRPLAKNIVLAASFRLKEPKITNKF